MLATREALSYEQEARAYAEQAAHLKGQRQERKAAHQKLTELHASFDQEKAAKVREARKEWKTLKARRAKVEAREAEARDFYTQAKAREKKAQDKCHDVMVARDEAAKEAGKIHDGLSYMSQERQRDHKNIELLKKGKGACPLCRQIVPARYLKGLLHHISMDKAILETQGGYSQEALKAALGKVKELNGRVESVQAVGQKAADTVYQASKDLRDLELAAASLRSRVKEAHRGLRAAKEAENPYRAQLIDSRGVSVRLRASLEVAREAQGKAERRQRRREEWAVRFKELRLWLVQEALLQLQVEVNNSLLELGLEGWGVSFAVERATAKGTVSKGFNVFIHAPGSPDAVPWEAWCGGETQRLRVAGAVGLANVIRAYTGCRCNLEVWDEPTQHLNEEGVDDMLAYFGSRARQRQLWLVDHRSLGAGVFDSTVVVRRDKEGSSICMEA